jgi:hypothetical protein
MAPTHKRPKQPTELDILRCDIASLERAIADLQGKDLSKVQVGKLVWDAYDEYKVVQITPSFFPWGRDLVAVMNGDGQLQSDVGIVRGIANLRKRLAKKGYRSTKPAFYESRSRYYYF